MEEQIKKLLSAVVHPETEQNIVQSGVLQSVTAREDKITVVLCFPKARDPFAVRIKNIVEKMLRERERSARNRTYWLPLLSIKSEERN